ncbi:Hypothetical protein NTJ_10082 [Nesidiocoris tenuis]|uniref:Uncharacterized protein n=1 Tax=Nesidiocoris tenuis TaxID=355587 RepID=A0ABN7AZ45_9HEMI|nr:Hypothetical protein NTJ_10082 [Nesidiocoris tenuis]
MVFRPGENSLCFVPGASILVVPSQAIAIPLRMKDLARMEVVLFTSGPGPGRGNAINRTGLSPVSNSAFCVVFGARKDMKGCRELPCSSFHCLALLPLLFRVPTPLIALMAPEFIKMMN